MAICSILLTFGIFYCHFAYFKVIWHIFPRFGKLYQEKSGSPDPGEKIIKSKFSDFSFRHFRRGI
jgi:hypothetical protein